MSRRVYILCVIGAALVLAAFWLTNRLLWEPGLTEENIGRIRPGMPLAEVEALLGGPAVSTLDMHVVALDFPGEERGYRWQRTWREAGARVDVQFFADGTVMAAGGRGRKQPGILARLRSWLGW